MLNQMITHSNQSSFSKRIPLIDILRGIALLAMTIYHFTWDLEFFGWAPPALTLQPFTVWCVNCCAIVQYMYLKFEFATMVSSAPFGLIPT